MPCQEEITRSPPLILFSFLQRFMMACKAIGAANRKLCHTRKTRRVGSPKGKYSWDVLKAQAFLLVYTPKQGILCRLVGQVQVKIFTRKIRSSWRSLTISGNIVTQRISCENFPFFCQEEGLSLPRLSRLLASSL